MPTPQANLFATVRTEGAILPPDLLRLIAVESHELDGLTPAAYHLIEGEKLNEAATRSFNRLCTAWANFKVAVEKLAPEDPATTATREKWLLPLFSELGYGRLTTTPAVTIEDKAYAISHGWQKSPIHLVGCRVDLDTRAAGVTGASKASPHSLLQEFLNRSPAHLWGFVANGYRLRVLRDTRSLARQAFVEFDLQQMFEGQNYADFKLLWLVCHQSRVEGDRPEQCILEKWSQVAIQRGTRLQEKLRAGVTAAIEDLGRGFLSHRGNTVLRTQLREGKLDKQDFYRQLLRQVYRLLFLFVAEDRDVLLLLGDTHAAARATYLRYYSTRHLRDLAGSLRGSPHPDLYRALRLVFGKLNVTGCPELALPALGSLLWSAAATPDLDTADLANRDLLNAVHKLAFTQDDATKSLRPVDYRNLGSEEFGSVYEGLLELHPDINSDAATFALATSAGNERKTSGSFYTPSSLVNCLLDSALDPVIADAIKGKSAADAERALLALKICDPASGSGHFLIAASHRLAKRLAAIRTGDEEPAPDVYRHALRDVICHCIYGVDLNPMAVELCKVSLWMEAMEPGKPLTFLDHRIRLGNSLLGATPALLTRGIPDVAYDAIEGDDKGVCREFKRQNRDEREGQMHLFGDQRPWDRLGDFAAGVIGLDALSDETIEGQRRKQQVWEQLVHSGSYEANRFRADAWCAAFFWVKTRALDYPVTHAILQRIERNPHDVPPWLKAEIRRLAQHYQFFHWHLAFPDVFRPVEAAALDVDDPTGWTGGFDLILGNPPWDTLSPDQREFFGQYVLGLRSMAPEEQTKVIEGLLADPVIKSYWNSHCRDLYATVHFLKNSGAFTLYAEGNLGKGDFNVYRMFVERALRNTRLGGYASQVVPAGLYGGANATAIRRFIFDQNEFRFLMGCENKGASFFPGVHPQTWFAVYAVRRGGKSCAVKLAFGVESPAQAATALASALDLEADVIRSLSPSTYAIPDVRQLSQLMVTQKMAAACPAFGEAIYGQPHRHYQREVDMGNDRGLFTNDPAGLPVYEGRMIDNFDHRAKSYVSGHGNSAEWIERPFGDPAKAIVPQWRVLRDRVPGKLGDRVDRFRVGFCDVANPRNERSLVAALIPPGSICGDKVPTVDFGWGNEWFYLPFLAVANALVVDWLARTRLTSPKMAFSLLDGFPLPKKTRDDTFVQTVAPLVLRLTCTGLEMTPFWNAMAALDLVETVPANTVPAAALMVPEDRDRVRAELDVLVARTIYGVTKQELSDILDSFGVLQRRELRLYGEFRTKKLVLNCYDGNAEPAST